MLLGIGFVLQQYSAEQDPESRFLSLRFLADLLGKPRWLLGIACMVAGALILIGGVTLLSVARSTRPVGLSFGSFSHWYAAAIIAGIAFAAVQAGHRTRGHVRATLTGLGAGLVFGIQDALTGQTLEILQGKSHSVTMLFTSWPAYALVGAGIVGLWLMQNAFRAAPLRAALPAVAAGEPIAGMALGIVVFGDRVQISAGTPDIEAGGIAALIIGVIAVARSSAFSGLRGMTHADGAVGGRGTQPHPAPGPRMGRTTRRSPSGADTEVLPPDSQHGSPPARRTARIRTAKGPTSKLVTGVLSMDGANNRPDSGTPGTDREAGVQRGLPGAAATVPAYVRA